MNENEMNRVDGFDMDMMTFINEKQCIASLNQKRN